MSTSVIRAALETTLKTYADAQTPKIPIAFENSAFKKPTTGFFFECFLMPSTIVNPTVDATRKRETGIFQVNCWALQGTGAKAATDLAQAIVTLFPVVPKGAVSIEKTPCVEKAILDDSGWFIIPVLVYYRLES